MLFIKRMCKPKSEISLKILQKNAKYESKCHFATTTV
jgi:hypothetical protein